MSIIKNTEELNNLLDAVQKLPVKKDEQEKIVDITENGTTVVTPDEGMTLSEVTVNVAVEEKSLEQILEQYPSNILISPQVDFSGGLTYTACWGAIGIDFLNLEIIDNGHFSYASLLLLFRKKSHSARLLGCKRPRNDSLSLPTFCDFSSSVRYASFFIR